MSGDPIVVGTDGSPTAQLAVDKAGELAEALDVPVHVVCVPSAITSPEWPARITAQEIVAEATDRLRGRGLTVESHLPKALQGEGEGGLMKVAESEQAQMVVVGNKGMTGIRRLIGSLPNRLSHRARCDVLLVATQSESLPAWRGGAIVVGTDGSSRGMQAVTEAARLSKALGGELHLVCASKSRDSSESALAAAATEAAGQGVQPITHALEGDPADALLDLAKKHDAAITAVGSRGMHGDEREWFGNVPNKISHNGTSSVLIVFTGGDGASDAGTLSGVATGAADYPGGAEST